MATPIVVEQKDPVAEIAKLKQQVQKKLLEGISRALSDTRCFQSEAVTAYANAYRTFMEAPKETFSGETEG